MLLVYDQNICTTHSIGKGNWEMTPHKLYLVQALKTDENQKRRNLCVNVYEKLENEPERRFIIRRCHFSCKWPNHQTWRPYLWRKKSPCHDWAHECLTKRKVFCAISKNHLHGPFSLGVGNVTGDVYLEMLQHWLFDKLITNEGEELPFKQDEAPLH